MTQALRIRCDKCKEQYEIPHIESRALMDLRIDFAVCPCGWARQPRLRFQYRLARFCQSCNVPEPFIRLNTATACTACYMRLLRARHNARRLADTITS